MTEGANRSPVMDSLKAQAEGVTPQQQQAAAFVRVMAMHARKCGAKTFTAGLGSDGSLTVEYDFEGLDGVS